jgi:hypothetical protein
MIGGWTRSQSPQTLVFRCVLGVVVELPGWLPRSASKCAFLSFLPTVPFPLSFLPFPFYSLILYGAASGTGTWPRRSALPGTMPPPPPSVDDVPVAETANAGVSGTPHAGACGPPHAGACGPPHAEDVKDLGFTGSYLTTFEIRKRTRARLI